MCTEFSLCQYFVDVLTKCSFCLDCFVLIVWDSYVNDESEFRPLSTYGALIYMNRSFSSMMKHYFPFLQCSFSVQSFFLGVFVRTRYCTFFPSKIKLRCCKDALVLCSCSKYPTIANKNSEHFQNSDITPHRTLTHRCGFPTPRVNESSVFVLSFVPKDRRGAEGASWCRRRWFKLLWQCLHQMFHHIFE